MLRHEGYQPFLVPVRLFRGCSSTLLGNQVNMVAMSKGYGNSHERKIKDRKSEGKMAGCMIICRIFTA